MFPLFPNNHFSTMSAARFQVSDQAQAAVNQGEELGFNSFKGTYIGHDLSGHLIEIDPHSVHFDFVSDYINAFPESKYFFETTFPFYMGSNVTQDELVSFYEDSYCKFVAFFQMNHPDWHDYTNAECLSHFKTTLHEYVNDIDDNDGDDDYYSNSIGQNMHQMTPNTLERPHFSVHVANNGNFIGYGYFSNADGKTTAFYRQIGQHGPFGYDGVRFNLENYLRERESARADDVEFYLRGNIKFKFDIDGSRHTCDYDVARADDNVLQVPETAYFLFEKSHQCEKKQNKQNRTKKIEERVRESRVFTVEDWIKNMSQVFRPNAPSMIEIQSKFASEPILPFQYLGLPVPRANPTDYREPLPHYNEDDEGGDD